MITPGSLIRKCIVLAFIPVLMQAQNFNHVQVKSADTLDSDLKDSRHSFFAGTGFGSNMVYLGSTISGNQPYIYGNLTYGYKNKLYASVSPVHLSGTDPFLAFYIGSISYNHVFNSWFDISAGAYRYQITSSLKDSLFSSFTYGDLTTGLDWRILYTKLTFGGLLSEENQFYLQIRNSRFFQTPDFFNKKYNISFDPYFNLLFGSIYEIEMSEEKTIIASSPGRQWRKYINYGTVTNTSLVKKFGILEADFGIPIALNHDKWTIEAELNYTMPLSASQTISGLKGFVFLVSAFLRVY